MVLKHVGPGFRLPGFKSDLSVFTGQTLQTLMHSDLVFSSMEWEDANKGNIIHLVVFVRIKLDNKFRVP